MLASSSRRGLTYAIAAALALTPVAAARAATFTVTDFRDTGAAGQLRTLMNSAAAATRARLT